MTDDVQTRCSPTALKLVADYWVLRIIDEIDRSAEISRFSTLQRALDGASPATLTNRLRRMEDEGLVQRAAGVSGRNSVSYSLTDRGRRVLPIIRAIDRFAGGDVRAPR